MLEALVICVGTVDNSHLFTIQKLTYRGIYMDNTHLAFLIIGGCVWLSSPGESRRRKAGDVVEKGFALSP